MSEQTKQSRTDRKVATLERCTNTLIAAILASAAVLATGVFIVASQVSQLRNSLDRAMVTMPRSGGSITSEPVVILSTNPSNLTFTRTRLPSFGTTGFETYRPMNGTRTRWKTGYSKSTCGRSRRDISPTNPFIAAPSKATYQGWPLSTLSRDESN